MSTITTERLTKILSETQAVITECNSRGVHGSVEVNARLFENVLMELLRRRAAMLQGVEIVESRCSNSPVIPDGWVMVPVEPTDDMIVNGFESEPDESFSDEKEWEAYDAMSGCQQAAHRAKLCWAAMIAAAPKLE
ncbi:MULTISPECIES: hypothetical protein [unclassified Enterobacter]|uniref:hypothetical protein n=1 Tax=unclassified Enterobacter TaxID=2608935 RepID=UPI0003ECDC95|nr:MULTISPECIES: hypothetical protein [unclassified Enterobacter]EWG75889.1 hypothetical protein P349_01291 [Enterobacter sp. DC4]EWG76700.1 hypothetical protein P348_00422 [Enterobacter sp. DC3]